MEGGHLSVCAHRNSLSYNEKHRNQQLTDYGAKIMRIRRVIRKPYVYPTKLI